MNPTKCYRLERDINFTGVDYTPIIGFKGVLDGNGHTLKNINIDKASQDRVGLFASMNSGAIKNLTVKNITIVGNLRVGALVGSVGGSVLIDNCHVSGNGEITGNTYVGGLVGHASYGSLELRNSSNSVNVTGTNTNIGGLVGVGKVNIFNCFARCTVEGQGQVVGGLVGSFYLGEDVRADSSFFDGTVIGRSIHVGGLIGYCQSSNTAISRCYSAGSIEGAGSSTGGLIGSVVTTGVQIEDCYSNATVEVVGNISVGGLVGNLTSVASASVSRCYFSGTLDGGTPNGIIGSSSTASYTITNSYFDNKVNILNPPADQARTTAQMTEGYDPIQNPDTYIDWDFNDIWFMDPLNPSYPTLLKMLS